MMWHSCVFCAFELEQFPVLAHQGIVLLAPDQGFLDQVQAKGQGVELVCSKHVAQLCLLR